MFDNTGKDLVPGKPRDSFVAGSGVDCSRRFRIERGEHTVSSGAESRRQVDKVGMAWCSVFACHQEKRKGTGKEWKAR
jgi:hypothetical protein